LTTSRSSIHNDDPLVNKRNPKLVNVLPVSKCLYGQLWECSFGSEGLDSNVEPHTPFFCVPDIGRRVPRVSLLQKVVPNHEPSTRWTTSLPLGKHCGGLSRRPSRIAIMTPLPSLFSKSFTTSPVMVNSHCSGKVSPSLPSSGRPYDSTHLRSVLEDPGLALGGPTDISKALWSGWRRDLPMQPLQRTSSVL